MTIDKKRNQSSTEKVISIKLSLPALGEGKGAEAVQKKQKKKTGEGMRGQRWLWSTMFRLGLRVIDLNR